MGRRDILRAGGGVGLLGLLFAAGLLRPGDALAAERNQAAFDAKTMEDALKAIGAGTPGASQDIVLVAPDIAENGAVVPINATSNIPNTEAIAILIEKNPNMLAAYFTLPDGTEPYVSTRIKMGQTSNVSVLVRAGGKFYVVTKEIKVTLGGCGG